MKIVLPVLNMTKQVRKNSVVWGNFQTVEVRDRHITKFSTTRTRSILAHSDCIKFAPAILSRSSKCTATSRLAITRSFSWAVVRSSQHVAFCKDHFIRRCCVLCFLL